MYRFVNLYQTKGDRKKKYDDVREHGATVREARVFRDWTRNHVERIAIPMLVGRRLNLLAGRD